MAVNRFPNLPDGKKIVVQKNGPYLVCGGLPLVRKSQIVSEFGEPLTWKKGEELEAGESYELCRCGHSSHKPFCDNTHEKINFDGTETADTSLSKERRVILPGGTNIVVKRDYSLCIDAGFCVNRFANIQQMVGKTQQIAVTTEMSSEGPIMGPLWVTGSISVERSDGMTLETRNRVTLCRCGLSNIKPLCDGTHRAKGIKEE
jgi:CDGSH-type Zn-finger protein